MLSQILRFGMFSLKVKKSSSLPPIKKRKEQVPVKTKEIENDTPPEHVFQMDGLRHADAFKSVKSNSSSGGLRKKKNVFKRREEPNNITQEDDIHDEEENESEPEDEQENELEDELEDELVEDELEDEGDGKYEENHKEYQDTDEESTVNDEIKNSRDHSNSWSLKIRQGNLISKKKNRTIPQEYMHSNTSYAEQVSLDSDLTDSIAKNRKYLMSDDDLRKIIEDQHNQIEQLKSRLDGTKKLELNPIQEGQVRKIVKFELWKRIQFIRHTHVLDGYETDGTIGKFVMDRLSIDNNCREGFWDCYKHVVRKTLKQHRNVVHSALRKRFISKSESMSHLLDNLYDY